MSTQTSLTGNSDYHYFILLYFTDSGVSQIGAELSESVISFTDSSSTVVETLSYNSKSGFNDIEVDGAVVGQVGYDTAVIIDVSYSASAGKKRVGINGNIVLEKNWTGVDLSGDMFLGHRNNTLADMVVGDLVLYDKSLSPEKRLDVVNSLLTRRGM